MRRRALVVALALPVSWVVATAADADEGHPAHPSPSPSVVQDHAEHGSEPIEDHSEHGGVPVEDADDDRPLPLVLGVFGGVNGAVVIGAAVVRRRERAERQARSAARSERRAVPALRPEDVP